MLGHLLDGQRQVTALLTGQGPRPPHDEPGVLVGAAPAAAWQAAHRDIERVLAEADPAAQRTTPMGPRSVADILSLAVIEPLVHAWDLAQATGHTVYLDPESVAATLDAVRTLGGQRAGTGMYAPAIVLPSDADVQDRDCQLSGSVAHSVVTICNRDEMLGEERAKPNNSGSWRHSDAHGSALSPSATFGGDAPNVWSIRHIIIPVGSNKR